MPAVGHRVKKAGTLSAVIEMELVGVRLELPSNSPIVLLRELGNDERLLPIFIAGPEAAAIALAVEEATPPRPRTHDLMVDILGDFDIELTQVVITELRDRTFYAELHLQQGDAAHVLSSRPSDAIALAVRTGSPVFAHETVLEQAGYREGGAVDDDEDGTDETEVLEQFREFIDNVTPDDFDG